MCASCHERLQCRSCRRLSSGTADCMCSWHRWWYTALLLRHLLCPSARRQHWCPRWPQRSKGQPFEVGWGLLTTVTKCKYAAFSSVSHSFSQVINMHVFCCNHALSELLVPGAVTLWFMIYRYVFKCMFVRLSVLFSWVLRAYTEQHQHTFTHSHFQALGRTETKKEAWGGGGGVKRRNCVEERI